MNGPAENGSKIDGEASPVCFLASLNSVGARTAEAD
jgi:hypothetical protein